MKAFISKVKDWCKKNGKKILVIGGIIIIAGVGIFLYRRDKEKLLDLIDKNKKAVDKVLSWKRRKKKNKHSKAAYAKKSPRSNSTNRVKPQVPQNTPLAVPESVLTKEDEKSVTMSLVKEDTVVNNPNITLEPSPSDEDTISVSEDSANDDSEIPQKTKKHRKKQHVFLVTLKGYEEKQKIIPFDADQFTFEEAMAQFVPYQGRKKSNGAPYIGYTYKEYDIYSFIYIGLIPENKVPKGVNTARYYLIKCPPKHMYASKLSKIKT